MNLVADIVRVARGAFSVTASQASLYRAVLRNAQTPVSRPTGSPIQQPDPSTIPAVTAAASGADNLPSQPVPGSDVSLATSAKDLYLASLTRSSTYLPSNATQQSISPGFPGEKTLNLLNGKERKALGVSQDSPLGTTVTSAETTRTDDIIVESQKAHGKDYEKRDAPSYQVRERAVPESAMARVFGFGSLGAGLAIGAAAEATRRAFGFSTSDTAYSTFVTDANAERLATSLSRMRGAALKLGQMLSIQDERVVPPAILRALERVRQGADIMPRTQLEKVLAQAYGTADWKDKLGVVEFHQRPIAAASIGQVHRGKMIDEDGNVVDVVFKIQYPGVARSIQSDLSNLKRLVSVGNLIPENFYIDEAIAAAREELERECDYIKEAQSQMRYRKQVLNTELASKFYVPRVFQSVSTSTVLVSEFVKGEPIDRITDKAIKNKVAADLLELTLAELFEFGFMQTDPNFANFFYDAESDKINLIDFGAAREYDGDFLRQYLALIEACARRDAGGVLKYSTRLGFLTGEEPPVMRDAHLKASFLVGEPFNSRHSGGYDFENNDIPKRTAEVGRVMLKYRLTPPPKEVYSLHRRLSGAFLTSTRMGATIDAASMLRKTLRKVRDRETAKSSALFQYEAQQQAESA